MSKLIASLGQSGAVMFVVIMTLILAILLVIVPLGIAYNDVVKLFRPAAIETTTTPVDYNDW